MDVIELTKKLISISSYVDKGHSEVKIATFLFNYFKKLGKFEVTKQKVDGSRFNLIIKDKYPTKVIFCGHMDTVQPKNGWETDPFEPIIKNNFLYGLGASDMKGNLAALISAFSSIENPKGLMLFLYVDEEYDMRGMKKFISEYKNKLHPEMIISADGKALCIGNGCRGLIEVAIIVQGKTGHASRPASGNNAILSSVKVVENFTNLISKKYSNVILGPSVCNLAFLQGGLDIGKEVNGKIKLGREGNNIPDLAEFVLDIRPASPSLNGLKAITILKKFIAEQNLKLINYKIRHNQGSWITPPKKLELVENVIKQVAPIKYLDTSKYGYIDTQMIWEIFDKPTCFTFGAGNPEMAHQPNEYIEIKEIPWIEKIFKLLGEHFAEGGDKNGNT